MATMSTVSPSSSTPTRRRNGRVDPSYQAYPYDYEDNLSPYARGHPPGPPHQPPSAHYGPQPPRGTPPASEFWSYEQRNGGYWGAPPPYDGYQSPERHMPPPARVPRGRPPPLRSSRPYPTGNDDAIPPNMNVPSPPRGPYPRRPLPLNRDLRVTAAPRGGLKDKKGDPLSILANVSAGMTGRDGQQQRGGPPQETRHHVPMPAPTSPLQRRNRPSPITPNQTPPDDNQRSQRHQVTPTSSSSRAHDQAQGWERHPEPSYLECAPTLYHPPRRRPMPAYSDFGAAGQNEGSQPAIVERGSFDSQGDTSSYRESSYPPPALPPRGYYYDDPPPSYAGYWDGPPHHPHSPYPPPRWNYGPPQDSFHGDYSYEVPDEAYTHHRPHPSFPPHHAPYTYVQQPRLEEKTILRKKFSWKHYPEVGD